MPEPPVTGVAQILPGLDLPDVGRGAAPRLQLVAEAQIRALSDAGRLTAGDALLVGLVLDLARAVGIACQNGKAAGAAMAGRQLLDAMEKLPPLVDPGAGERDEWLDVVAALSGDQVDDVAG
jgi:hypothetical protein